MTNYCTTVNLIIFLDLCAEMLILREGLDSSLRKFKHSSVASHVRIRYERSLLPSAATLIVVPQNLLEHWYEQIIRHLNLEFFSSDEGAEGVGAPNRSIGRGVVYLDGLGDIVDVQSPLSKLHIKETINSTYLSTYFIVVTTFERCILEDMKASKIMSYEDDNYKLRDSQLLTIRWLRLIVDEGHELGKKVDTPKKKGDSHSGAPDNAHHLQRFVSNIAAERRWVMSGTPTSGTDTKAGLFQLHRILLFLRHPMWGGCADHADGKQKRRRVSASTSSGNRPVESTSGADVDVILQNNQDVLISEVENGDSHIENNNSSSSSSSSNYHSSDINIYHNSSSSSSSKNNGAMGSSSSSSNYNGSTVGTSSSSSSSSNNNGITETSSSTSSSSSSSSNNNGTSSNSSSGNSAVLTPSCEQTPTNTVSPLARSFRSSSSQESSLKQWRTEIVKPCINQNQLSWEYLIELLGQIMVRHTKVI